MRPEQCSMQSGCLKPDSNPEHRVSLGKELRSLQYLTLACLSTDLLISGVTGA